MYRWRGVWGTQGVGVHHATERGDIGFSGCINGDGSGVPRGGGASCHSSSSFGGGGGVVRASGSIGIQYTLICCVYIQYSLPILL